jgi:hypothetical protein
MLLSERRQSEKSTYYINSTISHSGKGKSTKTTKKDLWLSGFWGGDR